MLIESKSNATIEQAQEWAKSKKATPLFISLAETYYNICNSYGINFAVAYCQFAKETGYGKFGGVLNESYCNPCGLKNPKGGGDKDPDAHMRFSYWKDGIEAQVQHLGLYAGAKNFPITNPKDPRHFPYLKGKCKTVEELGANWAPSKEYGERIIEMTKELESTKILSLNNSKDSQTLNELKTVLNKIIK